MSSDDVLSFCQPPYADYTLVKTMGFRFKRPDLECQEGTITRCYARGAAAVAVGPDAVEEVDSDTDGKVS